VELAMTVAGDTNHFCK